MALFKLMATELNFLVKVKLSLCKLVGNKRKHLSVYCSEKSNFNIEYFLINAANPIAYLLLRLFNRLVNPQKLFQTLHYTCFMKICIFA